MKTHLVWLPILLTLLEGCSSQTSFKTLPAGPIMHHLIALGQTQAGVTARGFAGATPPNTEVFAEVGKVSKKIVSNADGSFLLELTGTPSDAKHGELTFTVGPKHFQQGYEIRNLSTSLKMMTKDAFETDKEVDAVALFENKVAILSSQANLLRTFDVDNNFQFERRS